MKRLGILISILVGTTAVAQEVAEFTLSANKTVSLNVSDEHTTTVLFPKPISAIIGNGLTSGEDGNETAPFQYNHPPNSRIVALMARTKDRKTPFVVAIDDQLFLFQLRYSQQPNLAVTLKTPTLPKKGKSTKPVPVRRAILLPPLDFSPPNLLRLIELANANRLPTSRIPSRAVHYSRKQAKFTTTVRRITRFDEDDAIVVSGTIVNHSILRKVTLQTSQVSLSVNGRSYPVSLIDVAEKIPPRKAVPFSAILMGDGAKRADFSIDNSFYVLIQPPL